MGAAHDHGIATALCQAGQRSLVAHALSQANGVGDGAFVVGIGQVATAAHGRAQLLVVDRHHGSEAAGWIDEQVQ
ncbi:hypothetical protein D3C81_2157370 [compost metagenome]